MTVTTKNEKRYSFNGPWKGHWTVAQTDLIMQLKQQGHGCHYITDALMGLDGPTRWECVRDKMKQLFPHEHIKGDLDDPKAEQEHNF
ncbi:hypothetical protein LTS18_004413 [Coniosporium uncinatum]|uniref:Uncharacterized protein n=1 Tax=Coniosporium uncinatum TaxID=93489 RepID=A0ACC3D5W3_9PEZI|nr:hypothetical protein LTS18_004413 [Coniosporium uncinatum]